ncbi:MAG: DNA-3-methyladenine glycosylase [Planctomycetota bacterium]|nr:DNA-3-methyladenine glycosylase [Planctomycetota bacterium]
MASTPLPRSFYDRDSVSVAQALLGKLLLREMHEGLAVGRIVETEAYLAEHDPACHAARGRTRKNASMFGPPGHAYVYPIHARYCFNAVTEPEQIARQDEIRALASGPAKLCEALAIDKRLDGWDLTLGEQLWIAEDDADHPPAFRIAHSPRIGVTSGHELPLRFFVSGNPFVSGRRAPK